MSLAGRVTTLAAFDQRSESPFAAPYIASDNVVYGTTEGYRTVGGSVYKLTKSGVLSTLATTDSNGGGYIGEGLLLATDSKLYGATSTGGSSGFGEIFRIAPDGRFETVCSFDESSPFPSTGLIGSASGDIFGATSNRVFKATQGGGVTFLSSLEAQPVGTLAFGTDGLLYGISETGGVFGLGSAFRINGDGTSTSIHSFTVGDGTNPLDGPVPDGLGAFYSSAFPGGANALGSIYRFDQTGKLQVLYSFTGGLDGAGPSASPVFARDGHFYGTTSQGGSFQLGTIYRLSVDGSISTLYAFDDINGSSPAGRLLEGPDGSFYGTTGGGAAEHGTVFQMTPSGSIVKLHDFVGFNGAIPVGDLCFGSDGNLYGTTLQSDGCYQFGDCGIIYSISLAPLPQISGISPTQVLVNSPAQSLTITGIGFTASSRVSINQTPVPATLASTGTLVITIPALAMGLPGDQIITVANPAPGGGTSNPVSMRVVAQSLHAFVPGLAMISAPITGTRYRVVDLFDQPTVKVAAWNPTKATYAVSPSPPADTLRPGQGYWARFGTSVNLLDVAPHTDPSKSLSVTLAAGWNMIGNPRTTAVTTSTLTIQQGSGPSVPIAAAVTSGFIGANMYTYQSGDTKYETQPTTSATQLQYCGYWLYVSQACTITFPSIGP